jgi:uncharacterized protein (DUF1778 family)
LRATVRQDRKIRQAAALAGESVTDFVRDSAVAALDAAPTDHPRLSQLLTEPRILEKP